MDPTNDPAAPLTPPPPSVLTQAQFVDKSSRPIDYNVNTEDGFARFQEEYRDWAVMWVFEHRGSTIRDEQTANEIVQDAVGKLYLKIPEIRQNPRGAWIGELLNALRDYDRRAIPVGSLGARSADSEIIGTPLQGMYASSPSSIVYGKFVAEEYSHAVENLRPRLKEVYERKKKGMTHQEIALELGISADAVEKRMKDALMRIVLEMVKLDPDLALFHRGIARHRPIRTLQGARKAIDCLPLASARVLKIVYLSGIPILHAWHKANCASPLEARGHLDLGLEILSLLYDQKMPGALIAAVGTHTPEDESGEE